MNAANPFRRNIVFAFLLLGALLGTGFSAKDVEAPQAESLFTDYTGNVTASDLKSDLLKNAFATKRRFAKFNFAYFRDQVVSPYGKGSQNPVLPLNFFPGEKPIVSKTTAFEYRDGYYHWEGAIDAKFYSQAFFVVNKNGGFGNVQIDDRIISFHPMAHNKEVIVVIEEMDQNKFPSCGAKSETDSDPISVPKQSQGNHDIDILFVYPQYFSNLCGNTFWNNIFPGGILPLLTEYMTDELDIKFRQDGVIHQINFRGHSFCSDYNPRGGDFNIDLDRLGTNAAISRERDRVDADAVCMVVLDGELCGRAKSPWALNAQTAENPHMIVQNSCAVANHSLAHEFGHLLGLKHERADFANLQDNPCQFGYYMRIAFNRNDLNNNPAMIRRSIMAIGAQADKQGIRRPGRVGVFSDGRDFRFFNAFVRLGIPCNANANNEFERPANSIQTINMNIPILANYR